MARQPSPPGRPAFRVALAAMVVLFLGTVGIAAFLLRPRPTPESLRPRSALSASWSLTEADGSITWRGAIRSPGSPLAPTPWRATAHLWRPDLPGKQLVADSGDQQSRLRGVEEKIFGHFPAPSREGLFILSVTIDGITEERTAWYLPAGALARAKARAATAVAALEEEIEIGNQYGVVWPEAEALQVLAARELAETSNEALQLQLAVACEITAGELVSRRNKPETWLPVPARSYAEVEARGDSLVRRIWTPSGSRELPVWLTGHLQEEDLPGATAVFRRVPAPDDAIAARQTNRHLLMPRTAVTPGFWTPFECPNDGTQDSGSFKRRYYKSLQMIAFQRYAPILEDYDRLLEHRPSVDALASWRCAHPGAGRVLAAEDGYDVEVSAEAVFRLGSGPDPTAAAGCYKLALMVPAWRERGSDAVGSNWPRFCPFDLVAPSIQTPPPGPVASLPGRGGVYTEAVVRDPRRPDAPVGETLVLPALLLVASTHREIEAP